MLLVSSGSYLTVVVSVRATTKMAVSTKSLLYNGTMWQFVCASICDVTADIVVVAVVAVCLLLTATLC